MTRHLLVTNDFPPKVGGIQNYLWELWRRLPSASAVVYTTPYRGADAFDAEAPMRVIRSREPWLVPRRGLVAKVNSLADTYDAELVVLDPIFPAGLVGPHLNRPYAVIAHGAEVAIPGRLPVTASLVRRVLRNSVGVIAAGGYPAAECARNARTDLTTHVIPPGTDIDRFAPHDGARRAAARRRLGVAPHAPLVACVSRLVPRKGMDTLIEAAALLAPDRPDLQVVVAGAGRDRARLDRLLRRTGAPVRLAGRIPDEAVTDLYEAADTFVMLCRTRWGGLEQEGFGIVFLEAAAASVPQVAGASGGAHEAVAHGETGFVLHRSTPDTAAEAIAHLLDNPDLRRRMGDAARSRCETEFSYDVLAARLQAALADLASRSR